MNDKTMMMFKMVLRCEDLRRINIIDNEEIAVDLHGLGTKDSLVLMNNIINLNRNQCSIEVIHGFNHGTALKDMINGRFYNRRVVSMKPAPNNPGVTVLECASAN